MFQQTHFYTVVGMNLDHIYMGWPMKVDMGKFDYFQPRTSTIPTEVFNQLESAHQHYDFVELTGIDLLAGGSKFEHHYYHRGRRVDYNTYKTRLIQAQTQRTKGLFN